MFQLTMPWVLSLLVVPILVWFLVKKAPETIGSAVKLPFFHELSPLVYRQSEALPAKKVFGLFCLIWALLVFAASNPIWVGDPIPFERNGRNLMMVLDLSGSMEVEDMVNKGEAVTRLSVVKEAAKQFVHARKGDKIGLILFGSHAYLQTPLTYDHHNVLMRIADAEAGLAGNTTSIGDALGLAVKYLQSVPKKGRVIILLTDGVSNSGVLTPLKAAELAAEDEIKVYTIGLGIDEALSQRVFFMDPRAGSDLDEETLKAIAQKTGGQYFRATDAQSLQAVYKKINALETLTQQGPTLRPQHQYYPWPLGLALVLLLTFFFVQMVQREAYVQ